MLTSNLTFRLLPVGVAILCSLEQGVKADPAAGQSPNVSSVEIGAEQSSHGTQTSNERDLPSSANLNEPHVVTEPLKATVTTTDFDSVLEGNNISQDGLDGLDGADGRPGRSGSRGAPGRTGRNGARGARGNDGINGLAGSAD